MTAKLVALDAESHGEDIVERLERALQLAREGKLSSVAIALVYRDGCVGSLFSKTPNWALMIGSITCLQHRMMEDR